MRLSSASGGSSTCYSLAVPSGYVPILIFFAIAISFPVVAIVAAKLIRPSAPFAAKLEAYKAASDLHRFDAGAHGSVPSAQR